MGDFTLPSSPPVHGLAPSPVNFIKPGKRPLTSMTPLILIDDNDEVKAVIGASGGLQMITASAMVRDKLHAESSEFLENQLKLLKSQIYFQTPLHCKFHKLLTALEV